jgi:hypothetical protein
VADQWGQVQLGIGRLRGFGAFALGNTFHEGEEIVVPLTIGVGAQVFAVDAIYNPNISPLPVHLREEGVALVLDGPNDVLTRPLPVRATQVGNPFVGAVAVQLVDAGYLC